MSIRAVFLEKDGTLIDDTPDAADPRRMHLRCGTGAALRLLSRLDYRLFVVSNQGGIAFGHCSESELDSVKHRLADLLFRERLALDGFYYCPHHPEGSVAAFAVPCLCRKPMPGMLLHAAREHDIDLTESWVVGDVLHDIEAGNRAGCRTVLVDNGNETEWRLSQRRMPNRVVSDIYAAALIIAGAEEHWR